MLLPAQAGTELDLEREAPRPGRLDVDLLDVLRRHAESFAGRYLEDAVREASDAGRPDRKVAPGGEGGPPARQRGPPTLVRPGGKPPPAAGPVEVRRVAAGETGMKKGPAQARPPGAWGRARVFPRRASAPAADGPAGGRRLDVEGRGCRLGQPIRDLHPDGARNARATPRR